MARSNRTDHRRVNLEFVEFINPFTNQRTIELPNLLSNISVQDDDSLIVDAILNSDDSLEGSVGLWHIHTDGSVDQLAGGGDKPIEEYESLHADEALLKPLNSIQVIENYVLFTIRDGLEALIYFSLNLDTRIIDRITQTRIVNRTNFDFLDNHAFLFEGLSSDLDDGNLGDPVLLLNSNSSQGKKTVDVIPPLENKTVAGLLIRYDELNERIVVLSRELRTGTLLWYINDFNQMQSIASSWSAYE